MIKFLPALGACLATLFVNVWPDSLSWTAQYRTLFAQTIDERYYCRGIEDPGELGHCRNRSARQLRRLFSQRANLIHRGIDLESPIQELCALTDSLVYLDTLWEFSSRVLRSDLEPVFYEILMQSGVRSSLFDSLTTARPRPYLAIASVRPLLYATLLYADSAELSASVGNWRSLIESPQFPRAVRMHALRKLSEHPAVRSPGLFLTFLKDSALAGYRDAICKSLLAFLQDGYYDEYDAFAMLAGTEPALLASFGPSLLGALRLRSANDYVMKTWGMSHTVLLALAASQKGFNDTRILHELLTRYGDGQNQNVSNIAHVLRSSYTNLKRTASELLTGAAHERLMGLRLVQIAGVQDKFKDDIEALRHSDDSALAQVARETLPFERMPEPEIARMLEQQCAHQIIDTTLVYENNNPYERQKKREQSKTKEEEL